jgi:HAMP domain-containing protein
MAIVSQILFAIAACAAVLTIWKSVGAALPAIRALRTEIAAATVDHAIHVATLDTRTALAEERPRPARARRHPHPKPVTHRLHHFPHRAHAA